MITSPSTSSAFADMSEILQPNQTDRMSAYNGAGDGMIHSALNLFNHLWIHSIEKARKNSFTGFYNNAEDGNGNEKTNNGIS